MPAQAETIVGGEIETETATGGQCASQSKARLAPAGASAVSNW